VLWGGLCRAVDDLRIAYKISFRRGRVLATRDGAWRAWADPALLRDPRRFFSLNGSRPELRQGPERRLSWARLRDLEFDSPCRLPFPEANRARCRWFAGVRGTGGGQDPPDRPLVLLGHGWAHQGLEAVERIYVRRLVEAGCDVLLPVLPLHLDRAPAGTYSGEIMVSGDVVLTVQALRQAVVEMRVLVGWTRSRGYARAGVLGYSLGGFLAGLLACAEPQLDFAVIAGAGGSLASTILDTRLGRNVRKDLAACGMLERRRLQEAWAVVSPERLRPLVPRDRILLLAGRHDRIMPPRSVESLWSAWGRPRLVWLERGHYTLLALPGAVLRHALGLIRASLEGRRPG
jgi:dienelactone hydrolase